MRKVNRIGVFFKKQSEVVKLGNEIVVYEIVFWIVEGWPYERLCKNNYFGTLF